MAGVEVVFEDNVDEPIAKGLASVPSGAERFLNRELSFLDYVARVLAVAEDPELPVLERAKFVAIVANHLDEFFEVRVAGLLEQVAAGLRARSADGLELTEQLRAIRARVASLVARQYQVFTNEITPALVEAGIHFVPFDELSAVDRTSVDEMFAERIFPVLTPLAVDPAHPFPYISNLSLSLAVSVRDPANGEVRFARVKVPPLLPRFLELTDQRFVLLEQVISARLDSLFPGMEIVSRFPFRVTRDTDFEIEDEAEDLLEAVASVLRRRSRFGRVVRLEVDRTMTDEVLDLLRRELELSDSDVTVVEGPLDLGGLFALYGLDRADLKADAWVPQTQHALSGDPAPDFFRLLDGGDVLVHHPYDSFTTSVEQFVEQAASDPSVLAIKQTIYRTAGPESALVRSLIKAAEQGKQVVALIELKARFDEQANIERARVLEEAGVHVVYGLVGLKTHAKVLLVVRQEPDGIRRYCHVGTGNYNPKTAHLYEDVGLFSADEDLGHDLTDLFNHLTGYSYQGEYRKLLVAPTHMRDALLERFAAQAALGSAGRIILKMNSLVDIAMITALYDASAAGVPIDLIVRGISCLRPGVPGLSDTIRVRSIVGEFLEHSRVYRFGADPVDAEYLIGSADLMPRNLDRRVEAIVPVVDPKLRARLAEMLDVALADDVLAWNLGPDGTWAKVAGTDNAGNGGVNTQRLLRDLAISRTHATT
ncbi:MAG: polyphosphate kinase 1 [Acidimicrobiia bacterium]